ncbi:MAG: hypothetical protein L6R40_006882 [Gallowayella cf. fulva]|nr:MAG: hypothetical protein L6R40_006882 [Xanthomendoza cf. fulva]
MCLGEICWAVLGSCYNFIVNPFDLFVPQGFPQCYNNNREGHTQAHSPENPLTLSNLANICSIHPEVTRYERKRKENNRDNGQDHDGFALVIDFDFD